MKKPVCLRLELRLLLFFLLIMLILNIDKGILECRRLAIGAGGSHQLERRDLAGPKKIIAPRLVWQPAWAMAARPILFGFPAFVDTIRDILHILEQICSARLVFPKFVFEAMSSAGVDMLGETLAGLSNLGVHFSKR
jgi:hypothetical protein